MKQRYQHYMNIDIMVLYAVALPFDNNKIHLHMDENSCPQYVFLGPFLQSDMYIYYTIK